MKTRALLFFRCPVCVSALDVSAFETEKVAMCGQNEALLLEVGVDPETVSELIASGVLLCPECRVWYPIHNHVPVLYDFKTNFHDWFLRKYQSQMSRFSGYAFPKGVARDGELLTLRNFTKEWNFLVGDKLTFDNSHEDIEKKIRCELDWPEWVLQSGCRSLALDIACGYGKETETLQRVTQGEAIGVDLNMSLLRSSHMFKENPNLHHAICSLFALPFEKETFDIIYSEGTLHHTYSTKAAFNNVLHYLKRTGMIYLWVYALDDFSGLYDRVSYVAETLFRPTTAKLPLALQEPIFHALAVYDFGKFKLNGRHKKEWRFTNSLHHIRDRWGCVYAHRYKFPEVLRWFQENGLEYKLIDYRKFDREVGFKLTGVPVRGRFSAAVES